MTFPLNIIEIAESISGEEVFEKFIELVYGEGGDGDCTLVCKNYKQVANWFEQYFQNIKNYKRDDDENSISFYNLNESFTFTDSHVISNSVMFYILIWVDCPMKDKFFKGNIESLFNAKHQKRFDEIIKVNKI